MKILRTTALFLFAFANVCFAFSQNLEGLEETDSIEHHYIINEIYEEEAKPLNMDEFRQSLGFPDQDDFPPGMFKLKLEISAEGNLIGWENKSNFPLSDGWKKTFDHSLKILRFSPAMRDGVPVKCWVMIPLTICPNKLK